MTSMNPSDFFDAGATGAGNIYKKHNGNNGWIFGSFDDNPLSYPWCYKDLQIKWAELEQGDNSKGLKPGEDTTTITILIEGGPHEVVLCDEENHRIRTLMNRGDYVYWGPGVSHAWKVLGKKSFTITLRWKQVG